MLVCDRSTSSTCDEVKVEAAALAFLGSNPPPGSTFTVLATGCDVGDVTVVLELRVPRRWGGGVASRKRRWRRESEELIADLILPPLSDCSGIVATLWKSGRALAEANGHGQLILVSDLREVSAALGFNFEREVPKPSAFVKKLREEGLLPDLSGSDSYVCGVHDRRNPDGTPWTARQSQTLREAWQAAFAAMGLPGAVLREECRFEDLFRRSKDADSLRRARSSLPPALTPSPHRSNRPVRNDQEDR
ncbi:MAG: hypothetical protein HYV42_03495 [Candidatus Magasanikbacteria bacterium]|nr:hypothetical protein [Candidatus Magasanikbacteria bacterium]